MVFHDLQSKTHPGLASPRKICIFPLDKQALLCYNKRMNNYSYERTFVKMEDIRTHLKETLPEEDMLCDLAELFKLFGDSTRCKILYVLSEGECSVSDIADVLSMTQSAISHQLRLLRQSRLVRCHRIGKTMLYALADEHVQTILKMGMDHISE